MNKDDIIREALIERIEQLILRLEDRNKELKQARSVIWDLSVGVNNLMGLANETQRAQYRHLLDLAKEVRG